LVGQLADLLPLQELILWLLVALVVVGVTVQQEQTVVAVLVVY
jgi:hypothetical protein